MQHHYKSDYYDLALDLVAYGIGKYRDEELGGLYNKECEEHCNEWRNIYFVAQAGA